MTVNSAENIWKAHKHFLAFESNSKSKSEFNISDSILGGALSTKYDILKEPVSSSIFSVDASLPDEDDSYADRLSSEVKRVAESIKPDDIQQYSDLLTIGASLLNIFVQSNFTGPGLTFDVYKTTVHGIDDASENKDAQKEFDRQCVRSLSVDGEPAYGLVSHPHILIISTTILKTLVNSTSLRDAKLRPFAAWWLCRSYIIWQSLLDNSSSTLYEQIFTVYIKNTFLEILDLPQTAITTDEYEESLDETSNYLRILYYMELARAELIYNLDSRAEHSLKIAQQKSQLQFSITGMKARRTKFQTFDTAQFIFLAKSKNDKVMNTSSAASDNSIDLPPPIALELNSDLFLEKVNYTSGKNSDASDGSDTNVLENRDSLPEALRNIDPNNQPPLQDIDSALIMLKLGYIKSTSPYDNILTQEELLVMAGRLINSVEGSVNWCIYSHALWERSLIESLSAKTVERGTLQMQSLVDELGVNSSAFISHLSEKERTENIPERMAYIHQLLPIPKWTMDATLADRYLSLGSLKSALDIYERLQMWHQVALCYASVGQEESATETLTSYLEKEPNDARAWSILGDVTGKPEYWEKSWEIGKYAGSRRSLGSFYYMPPKNSGVERNIDLAIEYLNDALSVAPLHFNCWFLYGCAGLESEQYELAAEAFTRCVSIDDQDGKSWSNLSTSLLRLNKKMEAFNALKKATALASEGNNWRIWENYVTVAMDLEDWNQVLRGTRELLKIEDSKQETVIDLAILEKLVFILVSTEYPKSEGNGEEGTKRLDFFQRSCIELFVNELPPLITNNPQLWKLVAKVELWRKRPWAALESYEKGFRIYTHMPQIETEEKQWDGAVDFCEDLVDAYISLGPMEGRHGDGSEVCKGWKFKAKSAVRVLTGKAEKWWADTPGYDKLMEIKETALNA